MAHSNLAEFLSEQLSHKYTGGFIEQMFESVDRVLAPSLPACAHESFESAPGACDGGVSCHNKATVHDIRTDLDFCLEHFEGVICG